MSEKKFDAAKLRQAWGAGAASAGARGTTARFAWFTNDDGKIYNLGEVKSLKDGICEIAIYDTFMFYFGIGSESGEVMRVSEKRCHFYADRESMERAASAKWAADMRDKQASANSLSHQQAARPESQR